MKKNEIICLSLAALFIVFQHWYYFSELYYDRDLAVYAYNSLKLLKGGEWYHYARGPLPPGINFIIVAAFKLFGSSFKSIYLAALFFNLLSVFFIYLLAKLILSKETKFYFFLPIFFALIFVAEPFRTYAATTEVFLATFEIAGILFLGLNHYFLSGVLLGMGFLIRQTGVYAFLAGTFFIIITMKLNKTSSKLFIKDLLYFCGGFSLPLILISVYFSFLGVFDKFLNCTFFYNLRNLGEYLIDVKRRDIEFTKNDFWQRFNFEIVVSGLLSLSGLFYALIRRTKAGLLISIWFVSTCFGLSISAIYQHHFIQLIAPAASIGLLGISGFLEGSSLLFKRKIPPMITLGVILIAALIIPGIRLAVPFVTKKRQSLCAYAADDRFSAAQYVKEHTTPQSKIFVWDNFDLVSLFFWSERDNVCNLNQKCFFLPSELKEYWSPYIEKKDFRFYQTQLLLTIREKRPKYIIVVSDYKVVIDTSGILVARVKDFNAERKAFPGFFELLEKDYQLDGGFLSNKLKIYLIKNGNNN